MVKYIYFIIVVAFIDTFIQLPIITPYALSLGASEVLTGFIVAIYSLSNVIGNIVGGHFVDRVGRKRVLIIGMVLVSIILLFYPLVQTGEQLLIIRFLHGIAGGVLVPGAFALIGDRSKQTEDENSMAFAGAAIGIAAILGPALGGGLAAAGRIEYVFVFVALLFLFSALFGVKLIPESITHSERGKISVATFIPLLKNNKLLQACLIAFSLMVSNGTLAFALPIIIEGMGYTSTTTGLLLSLYGVTALIFFVTRLNRVYKRFLPRSLSIAGLITIASSMLLLSLTTNIVLAIGAMVVYGIGFAFIFPSINQMVANATDELNRGKAYGVFYAFFSVGVITGSSSSGFISQMFGLPFIFTILLMVVVVFTLQLMNRKVL
ncbi:MFS transporter [Alkalibacillus haloalkaliphilus]|uniref:MFS transporter n=1 Tax=Alkalibacillus haloalkaliphilus TaxID=94136 RepID=UPI0029361EF5|nr:MFS transporter [Alkalibacillus haloalkaliphilus]MDV2581139.1 MFS transporter [Alkalibacillus haloalkaliphilus]